MGPFAVSMSGNKATIGPTVNRKKQPIFDQAANRRFKPRITAPMRGSFMYSSSPVSQ
jgi:hypothetical protein